MAGSTRQARRDRVRPLLLIIAYYACLCTGARGSDREHYNNFVLFIQFYRVLARCFCVVNTKYCNYSDNLHLRKRLINITKHV